MTRELTLAHGSSTGAAAAEARPPEEGRSTRRPGRAGDLQRKLDTRWREDTRGGGWTRWPGSTRLARPASGGHGEGRRGCGWWRQGARRRAGGGGREKGGRRRAWRRGEEGIGRIWERPGEGVRVYEARVRRRCRARGRCRVLASVAVREVVAVRRASFAVCWTHV